MLSVNGKQHNRVKFLPIQVFDPIQFCLIFGNVKNFHTATFVQLAIGQLIMILMNNFMDNV